LAARHGPEVIDHGIDASRLRADDLEVGAALGQLAEARPDSGVAVRPRHVDGAEVVAGDLTRVPDRLPERGVEEVDVEHDLVGRGRRRRNRGDPCAEPPRYLPVVAVDEVEATDE